MLGNHSGSEAVARSISTEEEAPPAFTAVDFRTILVGETGVGKTTFGLTFQRRKRVPQVIQCFDTFQYPVWLEDSPQRFKKFVVEVSDIDASDECAHLRTLTYGSETDLYFLCFSLVARSSLELIFSKWVPEILKHHQSLHHRNKKTYPYFFLVGLKRDQRETLKEEWLRSGHSTAVFRTSLTQLPLTYTPSSSHAHLPDWTPYIDTAEGHRLAKQIKALGYLECSALGDRPYPEDLTREEAARRFSFKNDGPMSVYAVFETALAELKKRIPVRELQKRRLVSEVDEEHVERKRFLTFFRGAQSEGSLETKPNRLSRRRSPSKSIRPSSAALSQKSCRVQ